MASRGIHVVAAWCAALFALAAPPAGAQEVTRGEMLFDTCSQCHGPQGHGDASIGAPAIAGLDAWYVQAQLEKFRSGARGAHPDDVTGLRMRPMSRWLKGQDDVVAVAAYVASLEPIEPAPSLAGGNPERGSELYRPCTACHGANAEGNKNLFGPPLSHTNDWYQYAQLEKFRAGIRGANPQDSTGAMMRAMAMSLADEQALKDVIAYIMTIPSH